MLERVKELLDQGRKNEDIARETGLSVRQVQRYKATLASIPEVPKTREQLLEILQKKARQGDLHAIRILLAHAPPPEPKKADLGDLTEKEREELEQALIAEMIALRDPAHVEKCERCGSIKLKAAVLPEGSPEMSREMKGVDPFPRPLKIPEKF